METDTILLDHGAGGRASHELIKTIFSSRFANPFLELIDDAVIIDPPFGQLVVSTDSFVVDPLIFPGGDIGSLAVHGTVNDVSMRGAKPLWLTVSFIIEEGLSIALLTRIVNSMALAANAAGIFIIAGDTKVVNRGQVDKLFINTTGIGILSNNFKLGTHLALPGDIVLVSGTIGDHGSAIVASREGLKIDTSLRSDSAPLNDLVASLLTVSPVGIHVLRDPTRGGLATTLNEIALSSNVSIEINEEAIPLNPAVRGICELLGIEPFYLANEGKLICVVSNEQAQEVLKVMKNHPLGKKAAVIGYVTSNHPGRVWVNTTVGGRRILDMLNGEILPRIC